jgi:hypothetical protein
VPAQVLARAWDSRPLQLAVRTPAADLPDAVMRQSERSALPLAWQLPEPATLWLASESGLARRPSQERLEPGLPLEWRPQSLAWRLLSQLLGLLTRVVPAVPSQVLRPQVAEPPWERLDATDAASC